MTAVNSVINQSFGFENIELILIDDNSSDGTKDLILALSDTYENVFSVLLNENSGSASIPRNKGLNIASADYIMFLDSDDFYYPDICKKLYNVITSEKVDIVSSRFNYNYEGNVKNPKSFFDGYGNVIKVNSVFDFPKIISVGFTTQLWNKIYKKEIILENNITFPEGEQNEDIYFPVKYYLNANGIIILNDYYGYSYNPGASGISISITFKKNNLINMTNGLLSIFSLLNVYDNYFSSFKGEMLLGWTKWFIFTDLRKDKEFQKSLIKKVLVYYKNYSVFTRLSNVPLFFNILINFFYKCFGICPSLIIFFSNFRNLIFKS